MIANKESIDRLLNAANVTNYRISKETGISEQTLGHYTKGLGKIGNMKLDHAIALTNYYTQIEEEINMQEKINDIINKYNVGEVSVDGSLDPDFLEINADSHIIHPVADNDLELVFVEREGYDPETVNDYADRFDYDKVVGYRIDGGDINWL